MRYLLAKEILNAYAIHRVLVKRVGKYLGEDSKYNGIIRLIDADFLRLSYTLIKSKPGNMTRANNPWDINEGYMNISPPHYSTNNVYTSNVAPTFDGISSS
jgi:hypothetical protein